MAVCLSLSLAYTFSAHSGLLFLNSIENRQSLQGENLSVGCVFPIDDSARVQSIISMQTRYRKDCNLDQLLVVNLITVRFAQSSIATLNDAIGNFLPLLPARIHDVFQETAQDFAFAPAVHP